MNKTKVAGVVLVLIALLLAWNKYSPLIPTPTPTPDPVVVVDPVITAPIKVDHLCVVVFEETSQRGTYKTGQLAVLLQPIEKAGSFAASVKARGGEFLKFDVENSDLSRMPPWVAEAYKLPHPELPWIIAAGPVSGVSRKLPEVLDESNKLLEGVK